MINNTSINFIEIMLVLFMSIIFVTGLLVYYYEVDQNLDEINITINERPTLKDLAEPKRELGIIVKKTIKVNNTHKCISSIDENYCETHNQSGIKLPFKYSEKTKYSVLFYNQEEVYIINENENTNPSISYANIIAVS